MEEVIEAVEAIEAVALDIASSIVKQSLNRVSWKHHEAGSREISTARGICPKG